MESQSGLLVTGLVQWGDVPVPGARILLKAPGDNLDLPVLADTSTNADGWFALENPPVGDWYLYAVPPSEEYSGWFSHPVRVAAGQWVDGGQFQLCKRLHLLEPVVGAELATLSPVLRWASFPDAASYHTDVFNNVTGEAVARQETTDTSIVVDPPVAAGVWYQWSVYAFHSNRQIFAFSDSWIFMVRADAG